MILTETQRSLSQKESRKRIRQYHGDNKNTRKWRCQWCNGYRRRNWTRRHEFESWTDCISHSTNTLGKGMNPIVPSSYG